MKNDLKKYGWIHAAIFWVIIAVATIAMVALVSNTRSGKSNQVLGEAKRGKILEAVYGIGTVTATRTYQLKVGVTSTIRELYVREGDFVSKGTKLLALDGAAEFLAPFSGTVTALPNKVGETVFPQVPILTLTDLDDRYLVVSLEQQAAIRVRKSQKCRLSFDSMRDETFHGWVESVYSNNNNYLVRIGTNDLPPQILPGMTVDVAIGIKEHDEALIVPVAAINSGYLWAKRDGKKMKLAVKPGTLDGSFVEIVKGEVREGDAILPWSE